MLASRSELSARVLWSGLTWGSLLAWVWADQGYKQAVMLLLDMSMLAFVIWVVLELTTVFLKRKANND